MSLVRLVRSVRTRSWLPPAGGRGSGAGLLASISRNPALATARRGCGAGSAEAGTRPLAQSLLPLPGPAGALVLTYRPGLPNLCPGCHSTHWLVGRITAECAHCGTALPIATDRPGWSRSG